MIRRLSLVVLACFTSCASLVAADFSIGKATLTLPAEWIAKSKDDTTTLIAPEKTPHIQIRTAEGDVAAVQAKVGALIEDQVKDFKPAKTEAVTLGANQGVRLTGPGVEADDGDPASAEVTILAVGKTTVLVISHGEGKGTAERSEALAKILATLH